MKPKEFIKRLKDLKVRRFEKNEYAKSIGGGTGLTGNLLDDWVTAVTQGEYTKYEDIPVGHTVKTGVMEGWSRFGHSADFNLTVEGASEDIIRASLDNVSNTYPALMIFKDVAWRISSNPK